MRYKGMWVLLSDEASQCGVAVAEEYSPVQGLCITDGSTGYNNTGMVTGG